MFISLLDMLLSGVGPGTGSASSTISLRTEHATERVDTTSSRLQEQVDKLTLINLALWSLLKEKLGVTDEELRQRVEQIDLLDGKLDGKIRQQVQDCPQCGRTMVLKHQRCMYCGYTLPMNDLTLFTTATTPAGEQQAVPPPVPQVKKEAVTPTPPPVPVRKPAPPAQPARVAAPAPAAKPAPPPRPPEKPKQPEKPAGTYKPGPDSLDDIFGR